MLNPVISACLVCGGEVVVTRITCPSCETTFEGSFRPEEEQQTGEIFRPEQLAILMPFANLTPEQLFFVMTFVRSEGRFNRLEEELGMSYPTLRSRLDEIQRKMGFEPPIDDRQAAL